MRKPKSKAVKMAKLQTLMKQGESLFRNTKGVRVTDLKKVRRQARSK
jgi:hypothetical protein